MVERPDIEDIIVNIRYGAWDDQDLREHLTAQAERIAQAEQERDEAREEFARFRLGTENVRPWCEVCGDVTALSLARELEAARAALETIREATTLALPSEQTGPEWEHCVRVPVARLESIDAALAAVLATQEGKS